MFRHLRHQSGFYTLMIHLAAVNLLTSVRVKARTAYCMYTTRPCRESRCAPATPALNDLLFKKKQKTVSISSDRGKTGFFNQEPDYGITGLNIYIKFKTFYTFSVEYSADLCLSCSCLLSLSDYITFWTTGNSSLWFQNEEKNLSGNFFHKKTACGSPNKICCWLK